MKRYQLILLSLFSAVLLSLPWLKILPGWILFVAFLPLLIIEDHLNQRKSGNKSIAFFGYSYITFWLWNALTTWWVMHATLVGIILVVFLNACFMATVWWLFHSFNRRLKSRIANLGLITVWLAFEYVHYRWDIEWPWLTLGNGFANQIKMVQWYEYTGVLGGSLWVLIINLMLFKLYKTYIDSQGKVTWPKFAGLIATVCVPIIFSFWQYLSYEEKGESVEVVIVQPNVDPYKDKFGAMTADEQSRRLIGLSDSLVGDSTDYVVAPETALHPMWLDERLKSHRYIAPMRNLIMRYPNLQIVTGASTRKLYQPGDEMPKTVRKIPNQNLYYDAYNSALQIDYRNEVQLYHKSVLVSGVEKMPFTKYLSFVEDFIIDLGGTTGSLGSQEEPGIFDGKNDIQIAPVICYESVFGEYLSKYIQKGADLIFVITNDGWWKNTPGYKQHLAFARLRAIETRRSIARSANTGIPAIINQRGEILQRTDWWVRTAIKGEIKTNSELTFYVRFGDYIGRISVFTAAMLVLFWLVQGRMLKSKKNPH